MRVELKGVHYDLSDRTKDFIDKKLKRLSFADDVIVDLHLTFTREKTGYLSEAQVHFRWGEKDHIKVESRELYPGIEILVDKLSNKVHKAKDKIQDRSA